MKITISRNYNISRLQKWLDYELSGSVLLILSYFYSLTLLLAIIAAILFIPILFKVLHQEKRYGWFTFFIGIVLCPAAFVYHYFEEVVWFTDPAMLAFFVGLMFFYFYCATLRLTIHQWFYEEELTL